MSRRTTVYQAALALTFLVTTSVPVRAGIASTSGNVIVQAAPTGAFGQGTLERNNRVYVWYEQVVGDPGQQSLDHTGTGLVNTAGAANPGSVSPARATSYMVHFDRTGTGNGNRSVTNVTITFSQQIIGVWHTTSGLSGSDGTWAPAGLTYSSPTSRGLELGNGNRRDRYSISADGLTLTIVRISSRRSDFDNLRVLVNPEPSSGALAGLGVTALAVWVSARRRRRRQDAAVTARRA